MLANLNFQCRNEWEIMEDSWDLTKTAQFPVKKSSFNVQIHIDIEMFLHKLMADSFHKAQSQKKI